MNIFIIKIIKNRQEAFYIDIIFTFGKINQNTFNESNNIKGRWNLLIITLITYTLTAKFNVNIYLEALILTM